ncbi:hypothetical protein GJAV_G00214770 [Gymnothorax javanicus]|nr:hypothetical protein GJAV_G00214770 [Gymnothorax javanicus]
MSAGCDVSIVEGGSGGQVAIVQSAEVQATPLVDLSNLSWPMLSAEQEKQVKALLHQHNSVFSRGEGDVGCTTLVEHQIPLTDDIPIRKRYRRLPLSQYEQVKAHIQQLLEAGIVQPSSSPYSSPIVVVQKKKGGDIRLCVDYRLLNAKTRKDACPLPRIEESLDALTGARWFSTLDLASGYNQVPVAAVNKAKTAFCTPFGLFEFNRMPFGLCNSPSTFQRLMERIFGDQSFQSLLLYLDNIIIFSSSFDEHLKHLELVLTRLQNNNLKLKLSKCHFFQTEVKYLGHVVSASGVATDPDKVKALAKWKQPTTTKELRSFLGFVSYYRRFVQGFAKVAAPLHRLVATVEASQHKARARANTLGSHWTPECQQSFPTLKAQLISAPVLAYADFTKSFILEIDASHAGLGAVLAQDQDGQRKPVAFASRGLHPTERNMSNYSSRKLELLALKWAVTSKFREYLLGAKFVVFTDINPLSYLQTAKLGATEHRWASELAMFDFDIRYHPGTANENVDALSRLPDPVPIAAVASGLAIPPLPLGSIEPSTKVLCQETSALPLRQKVDLQALQSMDAVIGPFSHLWKRNHPLGRHKIQDFWDSTVYKVQRALDQDGRVYTICPLDETGPEKNVNRAELRVIPVNGQADPTLTIRTPIPVGSQDREDTRGRTRSAEESDDERIMVREPAMNLENGGGTSSMGGPSVSPPPEPAATTPSQTMDHTQVDAHDTTPVENAQSSFPNTAMALWSPAIPFHLMSAQAPAGSVASEAPPVCPAPGGGQEDKGVRGLAGSKYVKLNVSGSLYYTTVQTLCKEDSLLRSMCTGGTEVTIDSEGWVVLDRCGRHFGLVLNFLRDGSVPLPESQRELEEVLKEAQYYRVQGLVQHCLSALKKRTEGFQGTCRIPMITSAKEEQRMMASCRKPVVKLQNNRGNNKYSYTSNSDDNLLKNIELFDKLGLRFNGRVLFVKDVLGDEICCWSFYGEGRKIAEVCCTSIVYATEKKQTKVEFPEARIFEETLNILIYENGRGCGPGGVALLESGVGSSSAGGGQSEEEGAGAGDRRVRRIHVRRHIMHDERGHGQQTVYKD